MEREFHVHPGEREHSQIFCRNDGYAYHTNNATMSADGTSSVYLRCVNSRTQCCRGTVILKIRGSYRRWMTGSRHSCTRDRRFHSVKMLRLDVLEASRNNDYESPRHLVNRFAQRYHPRVAARVRVANMRHSMRRARVGAAPNIPLTFNELDAVLSNPDFDGLCKTADEVDNLYSGIVGPPGHQSLVFVSKRMLRFLRETNIVFADATFVPTPVQPPGSQVYQIVTVVRGSHVVPVLTAIMETKSMQAYTAILLHLRGVALRFKPETAVTDFELASQQAWMAVYPACKLIGCYVHYIRAVFKKVGTLGLRRFMTRNDRSLKTVVRCMYAIPLLPRPMMKSGYEVVRKMAIKRRLNLPKMRKLFKYFRGTWLRGTFEKTVSVFDQVHRTNNACEAANRMLRLETGPHHPNIWAFLSAIRRYEQCAFADVCAWRAGLPFGTPRRVAAIRNDAIIRNITADLVAGNISIRRFLYRGSRTVSYLIDERL